MRTSPANNAARALLAGPFLADRLAAVLADCRGTMVTAGLRGLAAALSKRFGEGKRPRLRQVAAFLAARRDFARWFRDGVPEDDTPAAMNPAAGAPSFWQLPAIPTLNELSHWLGVSLAELGWLQAGWRGDKESPGHHYRCRWIPRKGRLPRLIEAPLPLLKRLQVRLLRGILQKIPPHHAAHGFCPGRGILSFTAPHASQRCVLRMDIKDFFPSVGRARVLRILLTAGYPEPVAGVIANLCTTITPARVVASLPIEPLAMSAVLSLRQKLKARHLPQGAPTSPALANLSAWTLDCRLAGLAAKFGARYTRYADDLLFSGGEDFRRAVHRCSTQAAAILLEEGFSAAHRKTRIMPAAVSQRAAGLVLNHRPALPRVERDILKAILTNCSRHGPASQNRAGHPDFRAHLEGRLAHAAHVHGTSAAKLCALFEAISWE